MNNDMENAIRKIIKFFLLVVKKYKLKKAKPKEYKNKITYGKQRKLEK